MNESFVDFNEPFSYPLQWLFESETARWAYQRWIWRSSLANLRYQSAGFRSLAVNLDFLLQASNNLRIVFGSRLASGG